jgi:hypothetical protein
MPSKLNLKEFIRRSIAVHNNKYDYSLSIYKSVFEKLKIICPKHGIFEQDAHAHMSGKGCKQCSEEEKIKRFKARTLTKEDFVYKAIEVHKNKYSYDLVEYIHSDKNILIICKKHGIFKQSPHNHLSGSGCVLCGYEDVSEKLATDQSNFIEACEKAHGKKYDYSQTFYKRQCHKIKIICKKHGVFMKNPKGHMEGSGCPKCSKCYKMTYDIFVAKAKGKHGDKYTYKENNKIKGNRSLVSIICPKHGEFKQTIVSHLNGSGCQKCGLSISKPEEKWLEKIGIPNDSKHRHTTLKVNDRNFLVDGFCPETNTVYEFYGDFWHGNPTKYSPDTINRVSKTSFGELYRKTIEREKQIKQKYNLVSIWESDWKKSNLSATIIQ